MKQKRDYSIKIYANVDDEVHYQSKRKVETKSLYNLEDYETMLSMVSDVKNRLSDMVESLRKKENPYYNPIPKELDWYAVEKQIRNKITSEFKRANTMIEDAMLAPVNHQITYFNAEMAADSLIKFIKEQLGLV